MEKTLEKGSDKIQKICDALRRDTLEPAKEEATKIIDEATAKAEHIIHEAHKQGAKILEDAKLKIEKERSVFHSSLQQASKQTLEELKQVIEHEFFNQELQKIIEAGSKEPQIIAKLISALAEAVEKEGISTDFSAIIPQTVLPEDINILLGQSILKKLKEGKVIVGTFSGGVQIKLHDKKMTLDITEKTLEELLSNYVRKDFRNLLFQK